MVESGKKKKVVDFRDLDVYQRAFRSAAKIFEISKTFPPEERYSLTDQMRRSSRSVYANIAEAWRKRRYPANFVSKLSDADAEAAETETWLDTAYHCGYIQRELQETLIDEYRHICAQLVTMMNSPDRWCRQNNNQRMKSNDE